MTTRRIGFKRVRKVKLLQKLRPRYDLCVSPHALDDGEFMEGEEDGEIYYEEEGLDGEECGEEGEGTHAEEGEEEEDVEEDGVPQEGDFITSLEELEARAMKNEKNEKAKNETKKEIKNNNPPKQSKGKKSFLDWKAKIKVGIILC